MSVLHVVHCTMLHGARSGEKTCQHLWGINLYIRISLARELFDMYGFGDEDVGDIKVDALPPRRFGKIQVGANYLPRNLLHGFRKAASVL